MRPIKGGKYGMINVAYVADHKWNIEDDDKGTRVTEDWSNLENLGLQVFDIV